MSWDWLEALPGLNEDLASGQIFKDLNSPKAKQIRQYEQERDAIVNSTIGDNNQKKQALQALNQKYGIDLGETTSVDTVIQQNEATNPNYKPDNTFRPVDDPRHPDNPKNLHYPTADELFGKISDIENQRLGNQIQLEEFRHGLTTQRDDASRAFTSSENALNREYTSSENALNREHTSSENALNREHTSSENALNREHTSSENALTRAQRKYEVDLQSTDNRLGLLFENDWNKMKDTTNRLNTIASFINNSNSNTNHYLDVIGRLGSIK